MRSKLVWLSTCVLSLCLLPFIAHAGPLDPPAGPIVPTGKTLTDVQPRIAVSSTNTPGDAGSNFIINTSGSYYLTGNLAVSTGKIGIRITAPGVTLDLNGFTISGTNTLAGISLNNNAHRATISNGTISGLSYDGIDGGLAVNCRYINLTLNGNGFGAANRFGLRAGNNATITNCTASGNTGGGFSFNEGSVVIGCVASGNTGNNFVSGNNSTIRNCTATGGGGWGFVLGESNIAEQCSAIGTGVGTGFSIAINGRAVNCSATGFLTGFGGAARTVIQNCSAASCTTTGISVGDNGQVLGSTATSCGTGISASNAALIRDCTASASTNDNISVAQRCQVINCIANASASGHGINLTSVGNTADGCTASGNALNGIFAQQRSKVNACTTRDNGLNGIRINTVGSVTRCFSGGNIQTGILCDTGGAVEIRDNEVSDHTSVGSAGIRVNNAAGCRIEGNTSSNNYRNYDILSSANLIVRNTSSFAGAGGTYNIVAGNTYGPIISATGDLSTIANGNHPMANYHN